jgi:hypothetical protein
LFTELETHIAYGGSLFAAASTLPLESGLLRPRRLAALVAAALRRPRQAIAFIKLLLATRSENVVLSTSLTGQALSAYFGKRWLGVFPQNRLCRGVLILPERHADYLRGRHRQALRTNLRRAEDAGIRCDAITDTNRAFHAIREIVRRRRIPLTDEELCGLESWRTMLAGPEMTLVIARDRFGYPLAMTGAVIDDAVCVVLVAVASNHEGRWALHDYLVRALIARGVSYLLVEGGGPFGALGFDANVQRYQRLLGYELRHLRPCTSRRLAPASERACQVGADTAVTASRQLSPAGSQMGER